MVASCDAHASVEVVDDGEDGGGELQRHPVGGDEAGQRDEDDEDGVEPVDVLVPVAPGHGQVGNVHLLGIVLGVRPQRHIVGCAIWERCRLDLCGRGCGFGHVERRPFGVPFRVEEEEYQCEDGEWRLTQREEDGESRRREKRLCFKKRRVSEEGRTRGAIERGGGGRGVRSKKWMI